MLNKSVGKPQRVIRKEPLILVVEDNEDNLLYHTTILELSNYRFLKASDGESALDIAKDKLPDLILLDIVMPKINGIEVIKILRRNPLRGCLRSYFLYKSLFAPAPLAPQLARSFAPFGDAGSLVKFGGNRI